MNTWLENMFWTIQKKKIIKTVSIKRLVKEKNRLIICFIIKNLKYFINWHCKRYKNILDIKYKKQLKSCPQKKTNFFQLREKICSEKTNKLDNFLWYGYLYSIFSFFDLKIFIIFHVFALYITIIYIDLIIFSKKSWIFDSY